MCLSRVVGCMCAEMLMRVLPCLRPHQLTVILQRLEVEIVCMVHVLPCVSLCEERVRGDVMSACAPSAHSVLRLMMSSSISEKHTLTMVASLVPQAKRQRKEGKREAGDLREEGELGKDAPAVKILNVCNFLRLLHVQCS